jgi:uncharacterized protein (TIGR03084 family)
MFQQPVDFREESEALYKLLESLGDADFDRKTQFNDWTVNAIISHLHAWNHAADMSLRDPEKFAADRDWLVAEMLGGSVIGEVEKRWLDGTRNRELLEQWRAFYLEMTDRFVQADPKQRLQWAGPDMSVRSSITARLMETWAHGQELYDSLGVERTNGDRIKNIAVLGVNTFGWTFVNRGLDVPADVPHVRLTAPSGEVWTWNDPSETNYVAGDATDFCQTVTQVRNVKDTKLESVGETATRWMEIAQCFAGAAEDPPAPGTRFRVS